jgi:hypothetical protein
MTKCDLASKIEARAINEWTDDDCWLSDRHGNSTNGYPSISHNGIRRPQHVLAWEMHNAEPVPEGMVVMHSCDNSYCFNPNHLSIGTYQDNTDDAMAKGRHGMPSYALTDDDISDIHQLRAEGWSALELQKLYNVSQSTFHRALHRFPKP